VPTLTEWLIVAHSNRLKHPLIEIGSVLECFWCRWGVSWLIVGTSIDSKLVTVEMMCRALTKWSIAAHSNQSKRRLIHTSLVFGVASPGSFMASFEKYVE